MDVIMCVRRRRRRSISGCTEKSMRMTVDFGIDGFEGDIFRKMFELCVGYGR